MDEGRGATGEAVPPMQPPPADPQPAHPLAESSVGALQSTLRGVFRYESEDAALQASLARIGNHLDGVYVAFQADLGGAHRAADWFWEGFAEVEGLRASLGTTIVDVMASEAPQCSAVAGPGSPTILATPVFDTERLVVGAACAVVTPCDGEAALHALSVFEGLIGYMTLLIATSAEERPARGIPMHRDAAGADDPLFLAYAMAAELRNHHDLDQVSIGFLRKDRVRVVAVAGLDEFRSSNPGIKLIAAAMEECLDRREPIAVPGDAACHLHIQWSRGVSGGAVGSFPIFREEEVIAVVSVRAESTTRLDVAFLKKLQREMDSFAWLLPVSRLASRGLVSHAAQKMTSGLSRAFGERSWKAAIGVALSLAIVGFVAFGSIPYGFTVPCAVVPSESRAIMSPREGVLRELFVRPGAEVQEGQLLARLDTEDDRLMATAVRADIRRFTALIDQARAEGNPGEARVLSAQRHAAAAQLDLVRLRIRQAEIRAPRAGVILRGDLEQRVGATFSVGEPMFQMADAARVRIEMMIPEHRAWLHDEIDSITFAPVARPTERIGLDDVVIHPSSTSVDGENVFLARSAAFTPGIPLAPGMEGVVHIDVGSRSVWWVLSHRVTDWMRLQFWF